MPKYRRGSGSVYKRGRVWWVKYYVNGTPMYESAKTRDRGEARDFLKVKQGQLAEGRYVGPAADRTTWDQLAALVLEDYRTNAKKTVRDAQHRIEKHLTPFFGGKRAKLISAADLQAFIAVRQTAGASNSEINRELTLVRRAYNLGMQAELVVRKPAIRMLREPPARQGFFEQDEYERLLAKLPDYLRPLITFAFWTGWRIYSEILPLSWDQVDLVEGTVRLRAGTTKNGEGRVVALPGELRALLDRLWAEHTSLYPTCQRVFHRGGQPIKAFRDAWDSACKRAELVNDKGQASKIPHDFRRTAARNMVRAGIPERVVMQILGHKTRSMLDRYHVVNEGDLHEAAERLEVAMRARTVTNLVTVGKKQAGEEQLDALTH
jgi:integrase